MIALSGMACFGFEQNLRSIQADFIQYQYDPSKQNKNAEQNATTKGETKENRAQGVIYYSGSFLALLPNFAKWQYHQPMQKIVYLKDQTLISYEPLLQQVIYTSIHQSLNFLKIIQTAKPDAQNANLYLSEIEGQIYKLWIDNDHPERLEYEDALGNLIVIEFKNVILNPKLSEDMFAFSPPEGVDVIRH